MLSQASSPPSTQPSLNLSSPPPTPPATPPPTPCSTPSTPPPTRPPSPDSDTDFIYGDGTDFDYCSLTPSVFSYEEFHERAFEKKDGTYIYPIDEQEQERLDVLNEGYALALGELFRAKICLDQCHVLDLGTGTGAWAIEFADDNPDAEVNGVDLSPIQPDYLPPNVQFTVDNIEEEWTDKKYDYVHCRDMAGSIRDWGWLLRETNNSLKPGGWAEFQEMHLLPSGLPDDNAFVKMQKYREQAHEEIGRPLDVAPCLSQWVAEAGFSHVKEEEIEVRVGMCPEDIAQNKIGRTFASILYHGVDAFTKKPLGAILNWRREETEVFNSQVRNFLKTVCLGHFSFTLRFSVVTAQKSII